MLTKAEKLLIKQFKALPKKEQYSTYVAATKNPDLSGLLILAYYVEYIK